MPRRVTGVWCDARVHVAFAIELRKLAQIYSMTSKCAMRFATRRMCPSPWLRNCSAHVLNSLFLTFLRRWSNTRDRFVVAECVGKIATPSRDSKLDAPKTLAFNFLRLVDLGVCVDVLQALRRGGMQHHGQPLEGGNPFWVRQHRARDPVRERYLLGDEVRE